MKRSFFWLIAYVPRIMCNENETAGKPTFEGDLTKLTSGKGYPSIHAFSAKPFFGRLIPDLLASVVIKIGAEGSCSVRFQGQAKLGFFPLPSSEAVRLRRWLSFPEQFSALDPCVGDGAAFTTLLESSNALRYGIEIDAYRSTQARALGIDVLHANTLDVRCVAESGSLIYLNPPYDWEYGQGKNERLEFVFLQHTYRWLKCEGVLVFIIPQPRMQPCARLLAEHFRDIRVYRLTAPESVRFKQVPILAVRRKRYDRLRDSALTETVRYLERLAIQDQIAELGDAPEAISRRLKQEVFYLLIFADGRTQILTHEKQSPPC